MTIPRRKNRSPFLLLLLLRPAVSATTTTTTMGSPTTGARPNLFAARSLDLQKCYYNLLAAANYDQFLSQSDFISFVQLSSNHTVGHANQWGMNITSFNMLDPEFIKIYNLHACGNELVGCPSIEGIDIGVNGNKLQMDGAGNDGLLNQICNATHSVIDDINAVTEPTMPPTLGPTAVINETNAGGDGNLDNVTDGPSPSASPSIGNACPPIYVPDTSYEAASRVINPNDNTAGPNTKVYACKEAPFTAWCSQLGYEPGVAMAWQQAWTVVGECDADAGVDGGDTDGTATTVPSTTTTGGTAAPDSTAIASPVTTTTAASVISSSSTTVTMTTPPNGISTVIPDSVTPSPTPMVVGTSKAPTVDNTDGECPSCISNGAN